MANAKVVKQQNNDYYRNDIIDPYNIAHPLLNYGDCIELNCRPL